MQAKEEMRLIKREGKFVFCSLEKALLEHGGHAEWTSCHPDLVEGFAKLMAFRQVQRDNRNLKTI